MVTRLPGKTAKAAPAKKPWDAEENEAVSNFIAFSEIGDFIFGSLIAPRRQVPNRLSETPGAMQYLYEIKVHECEYHVLDKKKKVVPEALTPEPGETIVVGGKAGFDHKLAHLKVGQMVGIKFVDEKEATQAGRNPTKIFKVYLPKDEETGEFQMDETVTATAEEVEGDDDF